MRNEDKNVLKVGIQNEKLLHTRLYGGIIIPCDSSMTEARVLYGNWRQKERAAAGGISKGRENNEQ